MVPLNKVIVAILSIILVCLVVYFVYDYIQMKKAFEGTKVSVSVAEKDESSKNSGTKPVSNFQDSRKETRIQESKTSSKSDVKKTSQTDVQSAEKTKAKTDVKTSVKPETKTSSKNQAESKGSQVAAVIPPAVQQSVKPSETVPAVKPSSDIPDIPKAVNGAKLVVIFDDGGQNLSQLEKCVTLPFPVTVAVLPGLVHSREAAERTRKSGNEVMLHQPMQSVNRNINPGPGAITPEMDEDEIRSLIFNNLQEVSPVVGMNNHEGSGITSDAEKMSCVLRACSDYDVFFLDSRTNVETKVPYVANALGYSYYERNVFLDNTKNRKDIIDEIMKGVKIANQKGCAIMIGHVWSADILPSILKEMHPLLVRKGYTFTTVSKSGAKIN